MIRLALPLLLALTACDTEPDTEPPVDYPDLVAGRPKVGAAEGTLWLPMGTPLAGFSARCGCLGGFSRQDQRESAYAMSFVESTGVHVRPRIKAVWIENGDEHLVMTKADVIYSFDGMTAEVTRRLEELTGEDLQGKLTFSGNHNHSSYGGYSDHVGLYLGSDRFSPEIFDRMAAQLTAVAYEAYQNRRDAAIGVGWAKDWDPESRIYSDRRGDNNDLVVWPDMGPEQGGKDPYLNVIRMDDATSGDAIAVIMAWGMHPYAFGEQNSLATADATAFAEDEVSESFDHPVVSMFLQTGGGDASIRGKEDDSDYVQMESLGLLARDKILELYDQIPTSSDAITLETFSRRIPMGLDVVKVSRDGAVNWYYPPYQEDRVSDDVIYNDDGTIKTPLDEFNTQYGVAFCGSGDFDLPVGGMLTESDEYTSCMNVTLLSRLLLAFFRLSEEEISLPLEGMESVYTTATRLGPVPTRFPDGTTGTDDALFGFFPGEPVSMFTEQWRRRTLDELGYRSSILFGYSQDHEGYLLIAEDWLRGGYEPDINFWGPLGSEYIMEQVMDGVDTILATPDKEPPDQSWEAHTYPERTWETKPPDLTPEAGTRLAAADVPAYFWIAEGFELDLTIPAQLPRVAGQIQVAWKGGDPAVDETSVTLERQDAGGAWQVVTSPTGRPIDDDQVDFVVAWTPDPLFPAEALQTHYYWAAWQAVNHMGDRAALPEGRYRLHIAGHRATSTSYPYETAPYELFSDEFEVIPAPVTIAREGTGAWLSLRGHPNAFRLVDLDGQSRGDNPLRGELTVQWFLASGDQTTTVPEVAPSAGRTWLEFPAGEEVNGFIVTDAFGNWGSWGAVAM
jgi:neutral ceramidase